MRDGFALLAELANVVWRQKRCYFFAKATAISVGVHNRCLACGFFCQRFARLSTTPRMNSLWHKRERAVDSQHEKIRRYAEGGPTPNWIDAAGEGQAATQGSRTRGE